MPQRTDNFQKFVKQKKGSAIKEEIKQQKRKEKKEKAAAIEAHFERKRAERQQRQQTPAPTSTAKPGRPNKYPKKDVPVANLPTAPVRDQKGDQDAKMPPSRLATPKKNTRKKCTGTGAGTGRKRDNCSNAT